MIAAGSTAHRDRAEDSSFYFVLYIALPAGRRRTRSVAYRVRRRLHELRFANGFSAMFRYGITAVLIGVATLRHSSPRMVIIASHSRDSSSANFGHRHALPTCL